jgi:hypothetical protein
MTAESAVDVDDGDGPLYAVWDLTPVHPHASDLKNLVRFTTDDAAEAATRLRSLLDTHQIPIHAASWLGTACRNVLTELPALIRDHPCKPGQSCPHLAEVIERHQRAADLLRVVLSAESALRVMNQGEVRRRLRDLASGDHAFTKRASQSNERDLVFEIVCAGVLARTTADVAFVEPPDLVCSLAGVRYGVACKVAYGEPASVASAIRRGAKQIEASACEKGLIVVRVTDIFPHDELPSFPTPERKTVGSFLRTDDAEHVVLELMKPIAAAISQALGPRGVPGLAQRHQKLEAVFLVGHTLVQVHREGGASPAIIATPLVLPARRGIPDIAKAFFEGLKMGPSSHAP